MTIDRNAGEEYSVSYGCADIKNIANGVRNVPLSYINSEGNNITKEGMDYVLPLIQGECVPEYENGLPKHIIL